MGFLHNAFELGLLAVLLCVFKLIERRLTSGRAMQSPLRCDLGSVSAGARMMQPNLAPTDVSLIECRTVVSVVDLAPAYISRLTRAPVVHVCSPTRRLLTSGRALRCYGGSASAGAFTVQPNLARWRQSCLLGRRHGHARLWYTGAADLAPTDV